MSMDAKKKKKSIEGEEELRRLDIAINGLSHELNSFSVRNATNTEWLSLLPWPITSIYMEEGLLCFGIGINARVYAIGFKINPTNTQ